MMEFPVELEPIKNEVQRKIGRNLILFQQIEHIIKWLLARAKIEGYSSEFQTSFDRQKKAIHQRTLGQLICNYVEEMKPKADVEGAEESHDRLKKCYLKVETWLESDDPAYFERKKESLQALKNERNELVHHLLPRLNPLSLESWKEVEKHLDLQREKILPELDELQKRMQAIQEAGKMLLEFFDSEEGRAWSTGQDISPQIETGEHRVSPFQ
ncbi:MAG: hypothetical protein CDV28_1452 [Candidatus Electronema aureum]|uniref:Uncharacterized protein n=1 Tax=Candidatus Electronema aureum TaxID=2005002 RepID=A0A521FZ15_9BACT|nr:MAG: hypothetical protein CDV28_1452 [Candidatus Electronema aureum]